MYEVLMVIKTRLKPSGFSQTHPIHCEHHRGVVVRISALSLARENMLHSNLLSD